MTQERLQFRFRCWYPTPVLSPGKSHRWRSLVGCGPWSREELDMTERLHFHFSLLCIGEGNGNPLQCYCLENPRDGVTQSWTRLKWQQQQHPIAGASPVAQWWRNCLQFRSHRRCNLDPWVGKILCGRKWQPTPAFLPEESHGQRSLVDYRPQGCREWDTTEAT